MIYIPKQDAQEAIPSTQSHCREDTRTQIHQAFIGSHDVSSSTRLHFRDNKQFKTKFPNRHFRGKKKSIISFQYLGAVTIHQIQIRVKQAKRLKGENFFNDLKSGIQEMDLYDTEKWIVVPFVLPVATTLAVLEEAPSLSEFKSPSSHFSYSRFPLPDLILLPQLKSAERTPNESSIPSSDQVAKPELVAQKSRDQRDFQLYNLVE